MKFKVGDKVKIITNCSGCKIGEIATLQMGDNEGGNIDTLFAVTDSCGTSGCCCQENWILIEDNFNQLTMPTGKNIMSNIISFAKNLVLSEDEKLLRKHGLKNECGDFTEDAKTLVINNLVKQNETYLIEIATKKEAEEKE